MQTFHVLFFSDLFDQSCLSLFHFHSAVGVGASLFVCAFVCFFKWVLRKAGRWEMVVALSFSL